MDNSKAKSLLDKVQASIVDVITRGLEEGTITEDRAKLIAQMVLEKLPEDITYEELIRVIPKLDDEFQELSVAVVPIMLEYESRIKKVVNQKLSILLKQGKFDEAMKISQKALEFEKDLS